MLDRLFESFVFCDIDITHVSKVFYMQVIRAALLLLFAGLSAHSATLAPSDGEATGVATSNYTSSSGAIATARISTFKTWKMMGATLPQDGQPIGTTFFKRNALARRIMRAAPPLDPNSAAMVQAVSGGDIGQLHFDTNGNGGVAISTGQQSDPAYKPQCLAAYGPPNNRYGCNVLPTHIRSGAKDGVPTDYHSAFIDSPTGNETDAWLTCATSVNGNLHGNPCTFPVPMPLQIGWGATGSLGGDGTGFGATSSSIALSAGVIRAEDLLAGVDTHGFLVAAQCGAKGTHVYPAEGSDAQGSATCTGASAEPEYGQILWLDATGESLMLAINPAALAPYIRAWHDYGSYVGDLDEHGAVPQGNDQISPEIEASPAWLQVISSIRSDRHPIDTSIANGSFHLNLATPRNFNSYLHVLSTNCSIGGC